MNIKTINSRKLREVYDSYGGQMKLSNVPEAYKKLTNKTLDSNKLCNILQNGSNHLISYQQFCLLVADNFTTDDYDIYTTDGRVYFSTYFWTLSLLKTRYLIKSLVVNPITNALGICVLYILLLRT